MSIFGALPLIIVLGLPVTTPTREQVAVYAEGIER